MSLLSQFEGKKSFSFGDAHHVRNRKQNGRKPKKQARLRDNYSVRIRRKAPSIFIIDGKNVLVSWFKTLTAANSSTAFFVFAV